MATVTRQVANWSSMLWGVTPIYGVSIGVTPALGFLILENVSRESNNSLVKSVMLCLQTTLAIKEAFYSVCII